MNYEKYLAKLQKEIDKLEKQLEKVDADDLLEKAIINAEIKGLLTAKLFALQTF